MDAQSRNYFSHETSQSSSSVLPSTPSSELDSGLHPESSESSAVPSSSEQAPSARRRSRRLAPSSFNLLGLGKIPKEFSSLIRSHSISTRRQKTSTEANSPYTGYADRPSFAVERQLASLDMFGVSTDDERNSRKTKSSNRFYSFLTRSRSRSKSKVEDSTSSNRTAVPALPPREPLGQYNTNQTERSPTPSAKPSTRVQSRPLSSTTTTTNTTITPNNYRAKNAAPSSIPLRTPGFKSKRKEDTPSSPTKSTPRQKKHTLFGIPLPNSRKSSLGSRPATPAPVQTVDDRPTPPVQLVNDPELESNPLAGATSSASRPNTPHPTMTKSKQSSNSTFTSTTTTSTAPTSHSSRLDSILRPPKFFSARSSPKASRSTTPASQSATSLSVSPPSKIPAPIMTRAPSQPPHSRSNVSSQPTPPDSALQKSSPSSPNTPDYPVNSSAHTPKIVHTPATPVRSVPSPSENLSPDSSVHSRTQVLRMTTIDEGKRSTSSIGYASATSSIGKGRESIKERASSRIGGSRIGVFMGSTRSIKHGSFDFEKPGFNGIARSGSGGTVATGTSTSYSRDVGGESSSVPRDSIIGPGLAGVGTMQREVSIRRASEEEARAKKVFEKKHRKAVSLQPPLPPLPQAASLTDPVNESISTAHTEVTGNTKSSSWSKATGRKALFGTSARLGGLSHGAFSFEPPVPSPTGSTGTGGNQDLLRSSSIKSRVPVSEDGVRLREQERKVIRGDRPAVPVPSPPTSQPSPSNVGHRSGLKGRSLDLNLGLAWAPSKVREDALLPSTTFFSRTFSGSSSLAGRSDATGGSLSSLGQAMRGASHERSRSGSSTKRCPEVEELNEGVAARIGLEMTEIFRAALDADGYAAFKQCIHRFYAKEIPFHGPSGIVTQVELLLDKRARRMDEESKRRLLDDFIRIILQNT